MVGPVPPGDRLLRRLAELWMLFPTEAEYRDWFERAGFEDVDARGGGAGLVPRPALAVRRRGQRAQAARRASRRWRLRARSRTCGEPMGRRRRLVFAGRFVLGSLAGFVFVPVGAVLSLRRRR